jgi:hypothetical protein
MIVARGSNFGKSALLNKNIKIFLNYFLGPIIFVWLTYSIIQQIRRQPDLEEHLSYIREAAYGADAWKFWMVFLLMFINWGIEARKWQILLKPLQHMPFLRAFKATLTGVSFAMNTPNRIGEYGGRMLFVEEGNRIRSVSLTIVGSFSQLIITLVLGVTGLYILSDALLQQQQIPGLDIWFRSVRWILVIITVVCLLIFFRISWIIKGVERLPGMSAFVQHIAVMEELSVTLLLRVLLLSLVRFIVFVIQYNLLLQVLHVGVDVWLAFWLVSVLFLCLAIWPTIAILELGLRWEYSLFLFGLFSSNTVGIYAAATAIWLINLVVPALAGSLFLLGLRIFKKERPK